MVISSALQVAGDTKFPMYTKSIGTWGIRVVFYSIPDFKASAMEILFIFLLLNKFDSS